MKTAVKIATILVGVLFIVSGFVKANDPLGLSYKMQEFFEIWNGDLAASHFFLRNSLFGLFSFLNQHALALSVGMIGLEIMAGIALLTGWQKKFTLWLLLLLILFFTFLTGYAFASGKFKNCGCFGDCLPISPLASFIKDIVLLGLILFLLRFQKYSEPLFSKKSQAVSLALFLALSIVLQWYVLTYLPLVDCLPFKKGASITEGMKIPANAIADSFAIQFVYEKEGKKFEFLPENLPADLGTYKFIERSDKLVRKGNAEPAIKGFALNGITDIDSTSEVLAQPQAILYYYENGDGLPQYVYENLERVYKEARKTNTPFYVITTSMNKLTAGFEAERWPGLQFFNIDFTAFRTAARTNPCMYLVQKGTVKDKRSLQQTSRFIDSIRALY